MSNFDWFGLMRGITEMHVKSLKDSCAADAGLATPPGFDKSLVAQRPQELRAGCERAGGIWPSPRSLPDSPVSGNEGVGGFKNMGRGCHDTHMRPSGECSAARPVEMSADSPISDRFGDDRFTDNILRACRNLPQHGDDEEERDAAEEGALIEASGYHDPKFESNGRY